VADFPAEAAAPAVAEHPVHGDRKEERRIMPLLNDADCKRIEAAVARVEERSATEFVVAVVPKSANHSRYRALGAAAWSVAVAMAYFPLIPWGAEKWALALQLPIGLIAWFVLGIPAVHRRLIPRHDAESAVRATALRIFAERKIYETRDRTGMLLLISALERRVVILGDRGIHDRVGDDGWRAQVDLLVRRLREGRAADGIVEVLEQLETTLAANVPVRPGDRNELPDSVIRE
jgi:putative membrane protein